MWEFSQTSGPSWPKFSAIQTGWPTNLGIEPHDVMRQLPREQSQMMNGTLISNFSLAGREA